MYVSITYITLTASDMKKISAVAPQDSPQNLQDSPPIRVPPAGVKIKEAFEAASPRKKL